MIGRKIIIISTILLVTIITILICFFFNLNQYKPIIAEKFYENTNRELVIDGNIKLRLLPYIGLELNNIAIKNQDNLPLGNTLHAKQIRIKVELIPLFKHQINIDKLIVDGLDLMLIKSEQRNNWAFKNKKTSNNKITDVSYPKPNNGFHINLKALSIDKFNINFSDLGLKKNYKLCNISIDLPELNDNSFVINSDQIVINTLKLGINNIKNSELNVVINSYKTTKLQFSGNLKTSIFSANDFLKQLSIATPVLANQNLLNNVSISSNFFGTLNSITLGDLYVNLDKTKITGMLNIDSITPLSMSNDIMIGTVDISDINYLNGFKLPLSNIQIKGDLKVPLQPNKTVNIVDKIEGSQIIDVAKITLIGANLNSSVEEINKITQLNLTNLQKINPNQLLFDLKSAFIPFTTNNPKDLSQTTDLGHFYAQLKIKVGSINASKTLLTGPTLFSNGDGNMSLASKTFNYNAKLQLKSGNNNSLVDKIIFPLKLYGKITSIKYFMDWSSVLNQLINLETNSKNNEVQRTIDNLKSNAQNIINHLFK